MLSYNYEHEENRILDPRVNRLGPNHLESLIKVIRRPDYEALYVECVSRKVDSVRNYFHIYISNHFVDKHRITLVVIIYATLIIMYYH